LAESTTREDLYILLEELSQHKLVIVSDGLCNHLAWADGVVFKGPLYDREVLFALRVNTAAYIHGHSVGGTNPSLIEAVGAGNLVFAFDVPFNREVLEEYGKYFSDCVDLQELFHKFEAGTLDLDSENQVQFYNKILQKKYNWDVIGSSYHDAFRELELGT
jgi:rhamnosyltransferase